MPHLDGYRLAELLRGLYGPDELKLVALTAYSSDQDRFRSRKSGFDAHVAKPADPRLVEAILEQMLGKPQSERP